MNASARRRVALVIDDDLDMRELIVALLESISFDVDVAPDGIGAIDLDKEYDAILVDLNMPVFDGERLLEYWSLTRSDILRRVIIMTGYSRFTRGRELPQTFGTIAKPFEYEPFLRLVKRCAEQEGSLHDQRLENE